MGLIIRNKKTYGNNPLQCLSTNYSTDEQIVGTWIDGKPLYQRSFTVNSPSANVATKVITLDAEIRVVDIFGGIIDGNSFLPANHGGYSSNVSNYIRTWFAKPYIYQQWYENGANDWVNLPEVITLRYYKTTD